MYAVTVWGLLFVLPILSIVAEVMSRGPSAFGPELIGKWFVFWAVGVRLFLAGLVQVLRPQYTARRILGIAGDESLVVVRELGFANTSLGVIGLGSTLAPGWTLPAALGGALFYGLAGINHTGRTSRNTLESVATITDLLIAGILLIFFIMATAR